MPDHAITFDDLVRGEITFQAEHVPDYVLVRGNGHPLYTLVNPLDDALMQITHVLRGEDLLSSTPRQIALYDALGEIGIGDGTPPRFGHLPYVMGQGNRKLSKRDPESNLLGYRDRGFLPEGLLNYLALLGWAIAEDRDIFTMAEMVEAFEIDRVNPNPARFDLKKAEAINATHLRALPTEEAARRMVPYLRDAGLVEEPLSRDQAALLAAAAPLVQERMGTLAESVDMLGFLFVDEARFSRDPADEAKLVAGEEGQRVLLAARSALASATEWTTEAIEAALRAALIDDLGLKPRTAFGAVRVAITGRRISPPLFESMELLGRDRSLRRLEAAVVA
jgi:glutamyl-tRNA synthetase